MSGQAPAALHCLSGAATMPWDAGRTDAVALSRPYSWTSELVATATCDSSGEMATCQGILAGQDCRVFLHQTRVQLS